MTWILNKKTVATRSLDANDVNYTYFAAGIEFPTAENTDNPSMKKVTTGTGSIFYIPAADLEQKA
jgi:hypothetical protein